MILEVLFQLLHLALMPSLFGPLEAAIKYQKLPDTARVPFPPNATYSLINVLWSATITVTKHSITVLLFPYLHPDQGHDARTSFTRVVRLACFKFLSCAGRSW